VHTIIGNPLCAFAFPMKNLADIDKTEQRGRLTWLRNQYEHQIPNDSKYRCTWDTVVELDPTSSKKYLDWILRQVVAKKLMVEDHYKVPAALNEFIRCASMIKDAGLSTDLNAYESIPALATVLSPFKALLSPAEVSKKEREEIDSETAVLIDSPELLVVSPKTERASCFWGRGTQWCTAATESNNAFKQYTDGNGDGLFIIIDRLNGNKKYQIDKKGQFCDEFDNPLDTSPKAYEICKAASGVNHELDVAIACFNPKWIRKLGLEKDVWLDAVEYKPEALKYIPSVDHNFLLSAVEKNGEALKYIDNQTKEICLAAIKQNGWAIRHVENPSHEICLEAVKNIGRALVYLKDKTPEICLAAVRCQGMALKYVDEKTPEICMAAVQNDGFALQFVPEQTSDLCLAAVSQNGNAISLVKEQTQELCLAAVKQTGIALFHVKNKTPEICSAAAKQNPVAPKFFPDPTIHRERTSSVSPSL